MKHLVGVVIALLVSLSARSVPAVIDESLSMVVFVGAAVPGLPRVALTSDPLQHAFA
jgi:hypothetical protein